MRHMQRWTQGLLIVALLGLVAVGYQTGLLAETAVEPTESVAAPTQGEAPAKPVATVQVITPVMAAVVDVDRILRGYKKTEQLEAILQTTQQEAADAQEKGNQDELAKVMDKAQKQHDAGLQELLGDVQKGIDFVAHRDHYDIVITHLAFQRDGAIIPDISAAVINALNASLPETQPVVVPVGALGTQPASADPHGLQREADPSGNP